MFIFLPLRLLLGRLWVLIKPLSVPNNLCLSVFDSSVRFRGELLYFGELKIVNFPSLIGVGHMMWISYFKGISVSFSLLIVIGSYAL